MTHCPFGVPNVALPPRGTRSAGLSHDDTRANDMARNSRLTQEQRGAGKDEDEELARSSQLASFSCLTSSGRESV